MIRTPLAAAAALALSALAFAGSAQAQPYVIASAGASRWDGSGTDDACAFNDTCDRWGNAARLVLGLTTAPGIAGELVFWDFGTFEARTGGFKATSDATAVGIGVAFWADMPPRWSGTARLGLASVDGRARDTSGFSASQTSPQVYAGVALGYKLMPRLSADFAWDLSQVRVDDADIRDTVHAITLGLRLRF